MTRSEWKKSARKITRNPEQAGPGWTIAGILLAIALVTALLKGCGV